MMRRRQLSLARLMARLPLRWRITLLSFTLLAALMITLGILLSIVEEQIWLSDQANVLTSQASLANPGGRSWPGFTSATTLTEESKRDLLATLRLAVGKGVSIALLSPTGNMLALDNQPEQAVVVVSREQFKQWQEHSSAYLLANNAAGQRELVVLQPQVIVSKADQSYTQAILQLSMPTTEIDQVIMTTRLSLLLGIASALGIAAVLTLPLMRGALHPLVEMERVTARIADGELFLRLSEPEAQDEIGSLARSFNLMVAQLESAFVRQKRFVADVSHELRSPLTSLGGSLEMLMLEADNGDAEAAQRLMRGMYAEIERMRRLVSDLLLLARLDEGQMKPACTAVDIQALIKEVYGQTTCLSEGQQMFCHFATPLPFVQGNADQLKRVLLNIMENALKFTPRTGSVEIAASYADQWVAVRVRDTGIGIAPEALPHVFERFYRADSSRARASVYSGSGLGLAIAKEIVCAHAGTIDIKSEPGHGTTVSILLPAY